MPHSISPLWQWMIRQQTRSIHYLVCQTKGSLSFVKLHHWQRDLQKFQVWHQNVKSTQEHHFVSCALFPWFKLFWVEALLKCILFWMTGCQAMSSLIWTNSLGKSWISKFLQNNRGSFVLWLFVLLSNLKICCWFCSLYVFHSFVCGHQTVHIERFCTSHIMSNATAQCQRRK